MLDYQLVFDFSPVEGTRFYSQLDGLGDGYESVRDSLNFNCRVFLYTPDLNLAANVVTITLCLIGQEMLERKGYIVQILA